MVENQMFLKLFKMCLDIDIKMIFSKHYVPKPKTMYNEVKNLIKLSKIVKNGLQIVKNENVKKNIFLLFLCRNELTCHKQVGLWPIQRQRGSNSEKKL